MPDKRIQQRMDKCEIYRQILQAYGRYAVSLKKTGKQDKLQKKVTTACQNIRDGKVLKMPSLYAHIAVLYAIALQTDDQSMLKKIKDAVRTLAKQDYNYIQNRQLEDDFCEYMLSKPSFRQGNGSSRQVSELQAGTDEASDR